MKKRLFLRFGALACALGLLFFPGPGRAMNCDGCDETVSGVFTAPSPAQRNGEWGYETQLVCERCGAPLAEPTWYADPSAAPAEGPSGGAAAGGEPGEEGPGGENPGGEGSGGENPGGEGSGGEEIPGNPAVPAGGDSPAEALPAAQQPEADPPADVCEKCSITIGYIT